MLQRGDQVPHFEVRDVDGHSIRYSTIWQRRNLVLLVVSAAYADSAVRHIADLAATAPAFGANTTVVITSDAVPGLDAPAVVVADRWGEIVYVTATADAADLPPARELLEWISYVETRCPECEGEAK